MENASKALIIAGAILLAILIIGLGIFIYRQAANTVSDTGMDQLAVQQFNAKFENLLDKELSATTTKSLIDIINANNVGKQREDYGYVKCIKGEATLEYKEGIYFPWSIGDTISKSDVKSDGKYKASVIKRSGDGLISIIKIYPTNWSPPPV